MSRWLLEPSTGTYIGNPSARVRDELWAKAVKAMKQQGSVVQVWTSNNPQGFAYRQHGHSSRTFADFEGLALIKRMRKGEGPAQKSDTTTA